MKKKSFIYIAIILLLNISIINAQDSCKKETEAKYKYGIGGGAGFATGYGLSFRYIPKKFGAQINFAPYKDKETDRYSVGLTLIYMIIESKTSNLFLYQANHYYYNSQMVDIYNPNLSASREKTRIAESYMNNGFGFGIEIIMAKRIGLNLMAGYASYKNFEQLNVTGEAALYFKF